MAILSYERRKVYDPVLRLIHAWNGMAIVLLLTTAWLADLSEPGSRTAALWHLHIDAGFGLLFGLVGRVIWGIVGPAHARLSDLWHPRAWWRAVRHLELRPPARFGHNLLASGAYVVFYAAVTVMAGTGLALAAIEHDAGPLAARLFDEVQLEELFEAPHELGYLVILAFVPVHLGALILHERKDRVPLSQSMISGYQYIPIVEACGEDSRSGTDGTVDTDRLVGG